MIRKIQVLWYLNKEDLENYCIDFKEYKSHKLEGYEICDVDEDLIYYLCDIDSDRLEPIGFFKNKKEIENNAIKSIEFSGEDYYISIGDGIGCDGNRIVSWFDSLKKEYKILTREKLWVLAVTGYDPYDLSLTGKTLSYVLADILNINESSLDNLIPKKGRITSEEWNEILDNVYNKNKIYLGLNRVV